MKLGEFLISEKTISEEQLKKALDFQKSTPESRLGEILLKLNFITEKKMVESLLKHDSKLRLGELLIFLGIITDVQLQAALDKQKKMRQPLQIGAILVASEAISESQLQKYLLLQNQAKQSDFTSFLDSIDDLLSKKID